MASLSRKNIFSYIFPIVILLVGLLIMIATSSLIKSPKIECIIILAVFILFNILLAMFLELKERLKAVTAFRKLWHIIPGFLIGSIPIAISYTWLATQNKLPPFQSMPFITSLLTLATVSWEELWFRGVPLELGATRYSKFGASIIFALIFMLLHLLNPKIDLLQDGIQLFLAGYSLSVCYFAFDSLWAPIGMHFSNNYIQALFGSSTEPRTIFYTAPLLAVALTLSYFLKKRI